MSDTITNSLDADIQDAQSIGAGAVSQPAPTVDTLIETIRAGVVVGASSEARGAARSALHTLQLAIAATPGEPLGGPASPSPMIMSVGTADTSSVAGVVRALRTLPAEHVFDLVIAKLSGLLPPGAELPAIEPRAIQLATPVGR